MESPTTDDMSPSYADVITEYSPETNNELPMAKKEQKRRPKPKDGKILYCGVCGDRALGFNFDAISCESCKAFFRRNAHKKKPFVCSFEGNCNLDAHSRKFCSGCRLRKCFTIGMKKEWILGADQLQKRRQRQQHRRLHQITTDCTTCTSTFGDPQFEEGAMKIVSPTGSSVNTCQSSSDVRDPVPDQIRHLPSPGIQSHPYTSSPMYHNTSSKSSGLQSPTSTTDGSYLELSTPPSGHPQSQSSLTDSHLKFSTSSYPPEASHSSISPKDPWLKQTPFIEVKQEEDINDEELYVKPLNPFVKESLESLCKKYTDIFEKPYNSEDSVKFTTTPKTVDQLYNMTDMFIRRLIHFIKFIPEFKSLPQNDQIYLLKSGIMELFVLRSCVSFDSKQSSFKYRAEVKTEAGDTVVAEKGVKYSVMNTIGTTMLKHHMGVIHRLQELSGKDLTILVLIFVIQLMNPERPNVKNCQTVREAQERHISWLMAYLRSKHNGPNTRIVFSKLMEEMENVKNLGKASCNLLVNVEIERLEPLLEEIFDLG